MNGVQAVHLAKNNLGEGFLSVIQFILYNFRDSYMHPIIISRDDPVALEATNMDSSTFLCPSNY